MPAQHEIEIRVRYQETDGQGRLHHANFLNYFEVGRVELLRAGGKSYRQMESEGIFLVVAEATCRYFAAAQYDDLLRLQTSTVRAKGARIEHRYEVFRGEERLAEGHTVVACVDREGRARRLPPWLTASADS